MSVIFSHCFAMVPEIAVGNLSILYANMEEKLEIYLFAKYLKVNIPHLLKYS